MKKIKVMLAGTVVAMMSQLFAAAPTVTAVTAQQRYPWNGLVDIVVTISGEESDVAAATCTFAATNSATQTALAISHVTQVGTDSGSGNSWTRRFLWDTNADVGEVKIADVELVAEIEVVDDGSGGVQLWSGGPYWATCNVGASKPEEYGSYFMWGSTVGHKPSDNSFSDEWFTLDKCPTHGKTTDELLSLGYIDSTGNLVAAHDAATAHLGAPWRMPTDLEFDALRNNCDVTWTAKNGVNGRLFTGRGAYAAKCIFLPAAMCVDGSFGTGTGSGAGFYWSSTPLSDSANGAWYLFFASANFGRGNFNRCRGQSVRPLREYASSGNATVLSMVSTHLALDNRTGVRVADTTEQIRFSPAWETDEVFAIARVCTNGVVVANATEAGTFEWTPTQDGTYEFTHAVFVNGVQVGETLTATVEVNSCQDYYTVHFDANGGDGSGDKYMPDIRVSRNYTFNLPTNKFTREGYTFDGWASSAISTIVKYEDGEAVNNLTEFDEKTLYAHWKGNKIKVIFDYGPFRDKFGPRTIEYTVGTAYHDFPIVTSTKWSVRGWYTQPDGGERLDGGDVLPFTKDNGKLFLQADYLGSEPDPGDDPNPGEEDPDALSIDTTSLPSATELESYEAQLTCSGGTAPYAWSVSDGGYLDSVEESTFAEVGEAQGWYDDDGTWTCDLPFTFNYCGKGYDSVTVGDNGFVQFDENGESKIAMDDNDLYSESEGQDIFVEKDEDHVTFRWNRIVYSESENVVNCSITLYSNGVIRCSFGECYDTSHEVSLSDAALEDGYVAYDVEDGEDLVLTLGFFPDGLSLDADTGVISGTPNVAGHYEFEVNVSDDAGSICTKTLTLDVAANPNKKRDGSYSETIGGYTWYYEIENGEATIVLPDEWGWVLVDGDIIIPDMLGGCPVVRIGDGAFSSSYMRGGSVVIPESVETIGEHAFFAGVITHLSIGASVSSIGKNAFNVVRVKHVALDPDNGYFELRNNALYTSDLTELILIASEATELVLPPEMTGPISGSMFSYCSALASIKVEDGNERYEVRSGLLYDTENDSVVCAPRIQGTSTCSVPNGTKVIGEYAFMGCGYQRVVLPQGLLAIESCAFNGCTNLSEVALPVKLEYVGYGAFQDTVLMNNAIADALATSVTTPVVHDGWLLGWYYGDDFKGTLVVPEDVRGIADYAIDNYGVEEVILPDSVDMINGSALSCYTLKEIRFKGDAPTKIGAYCQDGELSYSYNLLSGTEPDAICYVRTNSEGWTDDDGNLLEYWPLDPDDPDNTNNARRLCYWRTSVPQMTIARDVGGGNCRVALASETEGVTIRYTMDGSEPNALSSVYSGEIAISVDTTIKAYATSDDLPDSEIVAWELPAQSELPLYWLAATNDSAYPWFEMCQSTSCAMQSGNVGHDGISSFEIATNGALEISFSWMASSEGGCDNLVFYVDDEDVAYINGEYEWEKFYWSVENGEHVLRWSYEKDGSVNDGDDCGRLKDMVITVTEPFEPIPDLGDEPTEEDVYEALDGSADEKLAECITNAANYNAYREWAETIGAQAVKDSPNAWVSFALGSDKLLENPPTDEDLTVEKFEPSNEAGKFDFTVSVEGVEVGSEAQKENLKQVFGLEGSTMLDSDAFSSGNVDLTFDTPENGKVKFTAGPKDGDAKTFFMKVKVNP